ncbi:hypothetical protein DENIT_12759 [Pseudomonas veronii]|nr:hypothetical protein DENIT_12759 [Pseudomonas veronii]
MTEEASSQHCRDSRSVFRETESPFA